MKSRSAALDLPDIPKGQLPPHLELQRTRVVCAADAPSYPESVQYSGAYMTYGVDNSLCLEDFRKDFKVNIISLTEDDIEFDMIGIDAAVANAFRRILLAEVPTMAFEKVFIANNTSVIQDEVLAHRLGMIPIKADPRVFEYRTDEENASEKNTIVFKLDVVCTRKGDRVSNASVKAEHMKWLPKGSEMPFDTKTKFTAFNSSQDSLPVLKKEPICFRYPDITVAKLRPGQIETCREKWMLNRYEEQLLEARRIADLVMAVYRGKPISQAIELEAHAVKGIGKTHAKWSPVATARYRMLPEVVLNEVLEGEVADELVAKCPVKVFDIEDLGRGNRRATVARPRDCTLCRECVRGEEWENRVSLRRVKDHFIFSIESTGALPPDVLFTESIKILVDKCQRILTELS